jgi:hypothetical protein
MKYLRGTAGTGLGATIKHRAQIFVELELPPCVHKQIHTSIRSFLLKRLKKMFLY